MRLFCFGGHTVTKRNQGIIFISLNPTSLIYNLLVILIGTAANRDIFYCDKLAEIKCHYSDSIVSSISYVGAKYYFNLKMIFNDLLTF